MRTRPKFFQALLVLVFAAAAARAGLYLPVEKGSWRFPDKPRQYRLLLDERQGLRNSPEAGYTLEVVARVKQFEEKRRAGKLTPEEAISLGGYYILLNDRLELKQEVVGKKEKYDESDYERKNYLSPALEVLNDAYKLDSKNFMILANLAMAYHEAGLDDRAEVYQTEVISNPIWRSRNPGFPLQSFRWLQRAEQMFLTLLRDRIKEGKDNSQRLRLDPLFPGAKFVGPDGVYAAGQTDSETENALPPDAVALVEQLRLWLPHDYRLRWLCAEVYNARGDAKEALDLIEKLVWNVGGSDEVLLTHRTALEQARPKVEPVDAPPWRADPRSIAVGGGIGLIIGMLGVFQLLQFFRRPRSEAKKTGFPVAG